ncbi:hypothetical protein [Hoeflea olei]|uniref:J domain-containing protein n=1 Tax=Hoeflea olei TaxID=1480615 RepID=A0A1C1Z040_9HYPH|nr:hypothetical protein [Hoeflea olei]OCW59138.1 hypothetical protein AWJ14_08705 [Hoeflea olei]
MIVGLSTFDAILDSVMREEREAPEVSTRSWAGMDGLMSSFVASRPRGGEPADEAVPGRFGYDDITEMPRPRMRQQPRPRPQAPKPRPAVTETERPRIDTAIYKRLTPEDIARDLGLLASDTPAHLQRKRRAFARLNHPDRAPAEFRLAATQRMQIANRLVDEALRKARASVAAQAAAAGGPAAARR